MAVLTMTILTMTTLTHPNPRRLQGGREAARPARLQLQARGAEHRAGAGTRHLLPY